MNTLFILSSENLTLEDCNYAIRLNLPTHHLETLTYRISRIIILDHVDDEGHVCTNLCFIRVRDALNSIWHHSTYGMRDWLRCSFLNFVRSQVGERNLLSIFIQYFLWFKRNGQQVTIPFRVLYECKVWYPSYDWSRLEYIFRRIMES